MIRIAEDADLFCEPAEPRLELCCESVEELLERLGLAGEQRFGGEVG